MTADPAAGGAIPGLDDFLKPFNDSGGSANSKKNSRHNDTGKGSQAWDRGGHANKQRKVVLSIFDIPPDLLTRAEGALSEVSQLDNGPASGGNVSQTTAASAGSAGSKRGLTCIRCELTFDGRPAQLTHFKSKLHMTNLRRQLSGERPISQQQLETVEGDAADEGKFGPSTAAESEDSGSDNSEDEQPLVAAAAEAGEAADTFDERDIADGLALARAASVDEIKETVTKTAASASTGGALQGVPPMRGRVKVDFSLHEGPRLTFTRSGSAWCFSLSSAALGMERGSDPWERLDALLGEEGGAANNRLWAVLIVQSGKFAAAVFEGQSVLCHKVLKRYTIRAKRGGSQSSYDSGGRKAQSAGATLRRYGEQSLREDARALLKEWEEPLKACCVVLTSVPKNMRTLLFEGKGAPFDRKDPRLRPVPFAVGRPTFEEVVSVHTRITSIIFAETAVEDKVKTDPDANSKESKLHEGFPQPASMALGKGHERRIDSESAGSGGTGETAAARDAVLEPELCPPSKELIEACEQGDVVAAATLLDRLELADNQHGGGGGDRVTGSVGEALPAPATVGHVVAQGGLGGGAGGWTAEEVINRPDGLARLMFPLHVAAEGGHVSLIATLLERGASPLAEDVRGRMPYLLAANKETRDVFRRARAAQPERWDWDAARVPEPLTEELEQRQKEKQKEKEKEKRRRAKQRKKEEKAKAEEHERQRKAKEKADAEERKARGLAAQGHCDACGEPVVEKKAFRRFEFTYCTTDCANAHKRKLAADAAERRFSKA